MHWIQWICAATNLQFVLQIVSLKRASFQQYSVNKVMILRIFLPDGSLSYLKVVDRFFLLVSLCLYFLSMFYEPIK
jgi:hypothetical protein